MYEHCMSSPPEKASTPPARRNRRRKSARPAEIIEAAFATFSQRGFNNTRVEDVAKQAGISKGLLYRYFDTKDTLLKAVIQHYVTPRLDQLQAAVDNHKTSTEDFLRGPFLHFAQQLPQSPVAMIIRLIITEGSQHPELTEFYWHTVVKRAMRMLQQLIHKSVNQNEFAANVVEDFPQLLVAPILLSSVWAHLFSSYQPLETNRFIASHINIVIYALKHPTDAGIAKESPNEAR